LRAHAGGADGAVVAGARSVAEFDEHAGRHARSKNVAGSDREVM
jgi:hypothetical protein